MNKLIIPLLAGSALLGGCHHATVRHTVQVPVDVVEHRHVVDGVVIVHQHDGDYRRPHQHERYDHHDRGRVVVVTPAPRIEHHEVTVIEHDGWGHHATPRVPPRQQRPQLPSQQHGQPQVPSQHGRPQVPPQHGRPQVPPQHGRPQVPPQHGRPQVPPQHGRPQVPPQHGRPPVPSHPGQAHRQPQHSDGRADAGGRPKTPSQGGQGRGEQKEHNPENGKSPVGKKERTKRGQSRSTSQAAKSEGDGKERPSDDTERQERGHR